MRKTRANACRGLKNLLKKFAKICKKGMILAIAKFWRSFLCSRKWKRHFRFNPKHTLFPWTSQSKQDMFRLTCSLLCYAPVSHSINFPVNIFYKIKHVNINVLLASRTDFQHGFPEESDSDHPIPLCLHVQNPSCLSEK